MTETTRAHHEAGHAVASVLRGVPLRNVTLEGGTDRLGASTPVDMRTVDLCDRLVLTLAGGLAESRYTGRPPVLDVADREEAEIIAAVLAERGGHAPAAVLNAYQALASALVSESWSWIERVAGRLVQRKTLSGAHVAELM
jgi:hypothetical protein